MTLSAPTAATPPPLGPRPEALPAVLDPHRLGREAATLDERMAFEPPPPALAPAAAARGLAAWTRAFAPGLREATLRRLGWDGWGEAEVARAVAGEPPRAVPPPAWIDGLREGWIEVPLLLAGLRAGATPPEIARFERPARPAFAELWLPFVRAARRRLAAAGGEALEGLAPRVREATEDRLLAELARTGELAVWERFQARRTAGTPPPGDGDTLYRRFVEDQLAGGLADLLAAYPALARDLVRRCDCWVAGVAERARRLAADRTAIAARFAEGRDPGPVVHLEAGLSDRHRGGASVAVLEFASGLRLVYKPRDTGVEEALQDFLVWCAQRGLEPALPAFRVLARPGYGWEEFVAPGPAADRRAAARYFRQAGALACLAWVLGGRDLHADNLVATAAGPELVDAEMLLAPRLAPRAGDGTALARANRRVRESVLGTGLVTYLDVDAEGSVYDIGGLRGRGGQVSTLRHRAWTAVNTDAMELVHRRIVAPPLANVLCLDGAPAAPEDFAPEMVAGFTAAYRFLLAHRAELVAPGGGGPLAAFAGRPVRVAFRPSSQYAAVLELFATPRYQRSGLNRAWLVEALYRVFGEETQRPALWPLARDERVSLAGLDLPYFSLPAEATALVAAGGETVAGIFAHSGLEGVRRRLSGLGEADLAEQVELLRAALTRSARSTAPAVEAAGEEAAPAGTESGVPRPAGAPDFLAAARSIGETLAARAIAGDDGGLTWIAPAYLRLEEGGDRGVSHYLYDGAAGIALFFGALARATGEERWASAAVAACRPLARAAADPAAAVLAAAEGIGALSGLGSAIYALAALSRLVGSEELLAAAAAVARWLDAEKIAADRRLDVEGGAAGAVLGLLALAAVDAGGGALAMAERAGERLLATAVPAGPGLGWPGREGLPLAGFAHGAAGIAVALARLGRATGRAEFGRAAAAALAFERSLFDPASGNWPVRRCDAGGGERRIAMLAFCHGAPGIGLARAAGGWLELSAAGDPEARRDAELAAEATARGGLAGVDHVCCGTMGRVEALLVLGRALGRPDWTAAAAARAAAVLAAAGRRGRFRLHAYEAEGLAFQPGFFRGLAGIGYGLLRLVRPQELPSVLCFEVAGHSS